MSSIWTPGGEHEVPSQQPSEPAAGGESPARGGAGSTPDEEALRQEASELEAELLAAPVGDVIANHCYGLFQLAALHLGQRPPHLDEARLAIDALSALVEGLGDRIGDAEPTLRDGLAQIRLAFVQIAGATTAANGSGPEQPQDAEPEPSGEESA